MSVPGALELRGQTLDRLFIRWRLRGCRCACREEQAGNGEEGSLERHHVPPEIDRPDEWDVKLSRLSRVPCISGATLHICTVLLDGAKFAEPEDPSLRGPVCSPGAVPLRPLAATCNKPPFLPYVKACL